MYVASPRTRSAKASKKSVGRPGEVRFAGGEALLLFDGNCRICRRTIAWLRAWDRAGRIVCMPYQHPMVQRILPDVPRHELETAILLVAPNGRHYRGAEALPLILRLLPGGSPLGRIFAIPRVPAIATRIYRWVAEHRHDLGCAIPRQSPA
jgi:predicted DCC family thiol-disulfide oxidoreductase YuxK